MADSDLSHLHFNPVYRGYFADPFVWRHQEVWYAIGTGEREACGNTVGNIFPLLQSTDFLHWHAAGSALRRPDPSLGDNFWAPEITHHDDAFYLYYSVGHGDQRHQLRVAVSNQPLGPYQDTGRSLIDLRDCPFAIDPHPFLDEDGQRYLFYATDFLDTRDGFRAGTGLMVAKMRSLTELESPGTPVMRARHDWQRFQNPRQLYDAVWDWHTLEGPCVRKHRGRYYCFYSGGRWETDTYGVDYVVADSPTGPYTESGSEGGARILKTIPNQVIGPGHNSIATGPDGADYLIYHAWDRKMTARRLFIDRLDWTADGPRCLGPTWADGFEVATAVSG